MVGHGDFVMEEVSIGLVTTRDPDTARQFRAGKEELNEWCRSLQKAHYDRLRAAKGDGMESSGYFLELLNILRRINSHLSAIGYAFQNGAAEAGD